jgi:hypothetical protein
MRLKFNCGEFNSNHLEKVHIETARIVCGFHCYASIASIYKETGWDKIKVFHNLIVEGKQDCLRSASLFACLLIY